MSQLHITTPQNVEIQQRLAGVGTRIGSTLIDFAFIASYIYIMAGVFKLINLSDGVFTLLYMLPVFFYSLVFEYLMEGQTPGKFLTGIRIIKLDGAAPAGGDFFLRWIFRIVDIWLFWGIVAVITILFSRNGQRLGDMAAGTTAVFLRKRVEGQASVYRHIPEDYQPYYPQVVYLQERDIQTLAQVLERMKQRRDGRAYELVSEAADAMRRRLQINDNIRDDVFLQRIVRDYNYYGQQG